MYCGDCGFLLSSTPAEAVETPVELAPAAELVDVTDGRRYRLRTGVNTLGRQGTDVLVMEGTVSRNHATLTVENGQVIIEDLGSSNGTKVGDRRIGPNQPTPATHGTPLKFGNWRAMLEIASGAGSAIAADRTVVVSGEDRTVMATPPADDRTMVGAPTAPEMPSLAPETVPVIAEPAAPVVSGPVVALLKLSKGTGSDISLTEETITIGRKPGNTIVLPDSYISGRHAEITTDNTGTYLTDVGSTNGTVVNGQKLAAHEKQLLLDGDEIQLGQNTYLFSLAEPEAEDAPPAPVAMETEPVEMPSLAPETTDEE
jgi:pSer/pThr/pTyr-binding forkhead associated (FHA) protein